MTISRCPRKAATCPPVTFARNLRRRKPPRGADPFPFIRLLTRPEEAAAALQPPFKVADEYSGAFPGLDQAAATVILTPSKPEPQPASQAARTSLGPPPASSSSASGKPKYRRPWSGGCSRARPPAEEAFVLLRRATLGRSLAKLPCVAERREWGLERPC